MQGIIQNSRTMWTQFKPVEVPQFPFTARRPVSAPLALFGWMAVGLCMRVHNTPRSFPHAFTICCCCLGTPTDKIDFACTLAYVHAPNCIETFAYL